MKKWFAKPKILIRRCHAHRGVEFFELRNRILQRKRIRKYLSLFIRGSDWFESWKKGGRKSRDTPYKQGARSRPFFKFSAPAPAPDKFPLRFHLWLRLLLLLQNAGHLAYLILAKTILYALGFDPTSHVDFLHFSWFVRRPIFVVDFFGFISLVCISVLFQLLLSFNWGREKFHKKCKTQQ